MAAASGPTIGRQITLRIATLSDGDNLRGVIDHTRAAITATSVDVREDTTTGSPVNRAAMTVLSGVTDIGAEEATRDVAEYSVFGDARVKKFAAQVNSGDFTFDLAYDASDLYHAALLAAPEQATPVLTTFALRATETTSKITSFAIDGIISAASTTAATDTVTMLSVTVSVTKGPTQINH